MTAVPATVPAEPILLRHDDQGVATLTLNRPKQYNALSEELLSELQCALEAIEQTPAAQHGALAPVVAFADVPGVQFDDQRERFQGQLELEVAVLLDTAFGRAHPLVQLLALLLGLSMASGPQRRATQAIAKALDGHAELDQRRR